MVTTSLDSILFLGRWQEHILRMFETTSWAVKDLVSHLALFSCTFWAFLLLTMYISILCSAFKDYILSWIFDSMCSRNCSLGHGGGARRLRCSEVKLNAVTTDDKGRSYAFHGNSAFIKYSIIYQFFFLLICKTLNTLELQLYYTYRCNVLAFGHTQRWQSPFPYFKVMEGNFWWSGCCFYLWW